jgi:two-component system, OmpR family, alkaline phosphatase synthesis response regulator PhoP
MPKILIVDDEQDIVDLLDYNLRKAGYETALAYDGLQAITIATKFKPDLILMDVMMPHQNGIITARKIRDNETLKATYILFLTSVAAEDTEILAFGAGADDYIIKPIKPQALLSRIAAFFRRDIQEEAEKTSQTLEIRGLTVNKHSHAVTLNGKNLTLPRKEFELLYFLMQQPGKIFNREQLLLKIWGSDVYVVERTVDVHIRKIREKIGENYIKTFKGVGYMLSVDE